MDYWENRNGVRFDEPSLDWRSNHKKLITELEAFIEDILDRNTTDSQIELLQWLLANASGGGDWRRLALTKIGVLKGNTKP